ncbi:hypothetical protein [Moraxella lacunata]|uniref:hypothetical protein n=1 Tax=Moraxella lacunata TaxID=477 RepID=UPI003EDFCE28
MADFVLKFVRFFAFILLLSCSYLKGFIRICKDAPCQIPHPKPTTPPQANPQHPPHLPINSTVKPNGRCILRSCTWQVGWFLPILCQRGRGFWACRCGLS